MDATQPQPTQKIIKILPKNKKNNIEKQFKEYSIPIVEPHEDLAIMATPPQPPPAKATPPLTLLKTAQPNFLLRTNAREVVDRRKIAWLLKSGQVSDEPYNPAAMKPHLAAQLRETKINSPLNHLQLYYRKIKNGCVSTEYKRLGKKGWGRAYPAGMLSLSALPRDIRNLIARDDYTDFDLASAHASIFKNICSKHNIKCPAITRWVSKKAEVRKLFYDAFSLDPSDKRSVKAVKDIINSTLYGGGQPNIERIYKEHNLKGDMPQYHRELTEEIHRINKELIKANDVLKEFARATKKNGEGKGKDAGWELTFLSYYAQEHEIRLVGGLMERIGKETAIFKHQKPTELLDNVFEYEYDGFKCLTKNVLKEFGDIPKFVAALNKWSSELGYDVCWEQKDMETELNWNGLTDEFIEFDEKEVKSDIETLLKRLNDPMGIKTDAGVARYIKREYPQQFIFKEGEWKCWEEKNNRWKSHSPKENPRQLATLITELIPISILDEVEKIKEKIGEEILSDELTDKMAECEGKATKFAEHLQDTFTRNKIFGACETTMNDDVVFDKNGDLLGFTNGVFDFKEFKFRPYDKDDFVSMTTGWEFVEDDWLKYNAACDEGVELTGDFADKMNEVLGVLAGILPNPAVRTLMLTIYASSLVGKCLEKFLVFNGAGRNGKGLLNEFWAAVLGNDYAYPTLPYEIYTDPINATNGNPALAKVDKKRWCLAAEPKKTKKLCNATLKKITGGAGLQARMLYSNRTEILNHGTWGIECNARLDLQEDPQPNGAEAERFIDIHFPNRFTEIEEEVNEAEGIMRGNPMLKEDSWRFPRRSAMMCLVLRHLKELMNADFRLGDFVPPEVRDRTKKYLTSNIQIHRIMNEICEEVPHNPDTPVMDIPCIEIKDLVVAIHGWIDDRRELAKDCWKKTAIKDFFETNGLYKKNYRGDHKYHDENGHKKHARGALLWYKMKVEEEEE